MALDQFVSVIHLDDFGREFLNSSRMLSIRKFPQNLELKILNQDSWLNRMCAFCESCGVFNWLGHSQETFLSLEVFLDSTISFVNFHLIAGYQISEHIL